MTTTATETIHLPSPGAQLFPLCGEHRGFVLIDQDPNEETCAGCLARIPELVETLDH